MAARAIATYLPAQLAKEKEQRLARAQRWLAAAKPQDTASASFRLQGLVWTKAPP